MNYTRCLGLALIFGVLGLFNPFDDKEGLNYKLNEKQFNEIIKNNNEIHDDIHKIMESHQKEQKSDTINNY